MAISTTFNVTSLAVAPSMDGFSQVVVTVTSQVISTDGTYTAQQTFTDTVNPPNLTDFIPYNQLTQAEVMKWIPDYGSDSKVLAFLADNIQQQANPPVIVPPLPWG